MVKPQSVLQTNGKAPGRPSINGLAWWLAGMVVVLLGVVFWMNRRPAPPEGRVPPPGGRPGFPGKVKMARGVVQGFRHNPHLDINAIQVRAGQAGLVTIDFRPHTATAVMALARENDSVEVAYTSHPNDEVVGYTLVSVKNERTGEKLVAEELPPPPDVPTNHSAEYFRFRHPDLVTDGYGGIVAIRNGHLLFHFKPGLVDDILPLIKTAGEIGLSAVWRDDHFGFVNVNRDKVYIVLSVTIDNKTFLVR